MSHKISLSIPTSGGDRVFYVSNKAILLSVITLLVAAVGLGTWFVQNHQNQEQQDLKLNQLMNKLYVAEEQSAEFEVRYNEQLEQSHTLAQELEEKRSKLAILGQRIYDVESVLGITDEELQIHEDLTQRIDVAAVDSAVRATLFRLIPNSAPMSYERVSSSFGRRVHPVSGKSHTHTGIDLTCPVGEKIYAPADGVVETVRPSDKGFGNFLTIRHAFGFMSSYAHLHQFKARSGQFVNKGDLIATCGNSGISTGPHLHYEIRFLGRALNPQYSIDWTPENFDYMFEKEKRVNWAPLVQMVDDLVRLQVNLTHNPYIDNTVDTVNKDSVPLDSTQMTN